MRELGQMIDSNQIDVCQYFTMHPFSATEKNIYDSALHDIDFFKELYIQSNKTYEHLAKAASILNNSAKNLLVITGYRGCGKTNFLHLIKHLAEGGDVLVNFAQLRLDELAGAGDIEDLRKSIDEKYADSLSKIKLTLSGDFYDMPDSELCDRLISSLPLQLKGEYQYINFDESGMGRKDPFSTKLFYLMRSSIQASLSEGTIKHRLELLDTFVQRNLWAIKENFENIEFDALMQLGDQIVRNQSNQRILDNLYTQLLDELTHLTLEQLLFIYILWDYSGVIIRSGATDTKIVYLLDNIDIISDEITDIFENTMMGVWRYIWDSRNVFIQIKELHNEQDKPFIALYERSKFIVAMRETTAMHISGHLRDKMRALMEHYDVSTDVDESRIMKRRIELAVGLINHGEIKNKGFSCAIVNLNALNTDRLLMKNLFQLNNNDYRTAARAISTICYEHAAQVETAIQLINSKDANKIFGGRGIIYHLLLEAFFDWNYFGAIGIESVHNPNHSIALRKEYGYSCARIILTILCNKQAKVLERFFVNPEESVRLSDFKGMLGNIIDLEDFVKIVDGMYALREKRYWNHLVTFDNIQVYSPRVIEKFLNTEDDSLARNDEIYIRATPAGQIFADLLCIHFEYFAARFSASARSLPLFLLTNLDDRGQWQTVKRIITDVYIAVKQCCSNLKEYNKRVLSTQRQNHYSEIVNSSFYFEQKFHEERIIHNHISYLEAYRHYILSCAIENSRKNEINKFLLEIIKKYLNLLKYDPNEGIPLNRDLFYSDNSKLLFNELNVCIEKIEKHPNETHSIEITRSFYNRHYSGQQCAFFMQEKISYGNG